MAPLANDPIMSGTSIQSFRHLKHQNLSTGDDFIHSSGIFFLVPLLATMEAVAPLANDPIMSGRSIGSFRHLEHKNPSIILDSIVICRWLQENGKKVRRRRRRRRRRRKSYSYRRGLIVQVATDIECMDLGTKTLIKIIRGYCPTFMFGEFCLRDFVLGDFYHWN